MGETQLTVEFIDATVAPLWSGCNLQIKAGEFVAILGTNGAGKTTMLNAILNHDLLTHGEIRTCGRISHIPQQRMFNELPLRVVDLVGLAAAHGVFSQRRANPADIDWALATVGATALRDRRVSALSGGQQQLVRQAQAVVTRPQILLADEPLLSLDPAAQQRTVAWMDRLRQETGMTVIFVTHALNPIINVVDRIVYLAEGKHKVGTPKEVLTSETLSALYGSPITVSDSGQVMS